MTRPPRCRVCGYDEREGTATVPVQAKSADAETQVIATYLAVQPSLFDTMADDAP